MELISNLKNSITNLENKSSKIYFFTQDTKGNPKASIHYIYQMAYVLKQNGFNSVILHEKSDYTSVSSWIDSKYSDELPHQYIEGQNLNIFPEDYLIVPEIFAYIMPQLTNLNCTKIVLCQSYDYIFETLQPGQTWSDFGFKKCQSDNDIILYTNADICLTNNLYNQIVNTCAKYNCTFSFRKDFKEKIEHEKTN